MLLLLLLLSRMPCILMRSCLIKIQAVNNNQKHVYMFIVLLRLLGASEIVRFQNEIQL